MRAMLLAAALLAACAHSGWTRSELYFGTARPAGLSPVSDGEWKRFVAEEIAPRFPQGFTILAAGGHWRADAGPQDELSHVLLVVWPDGQDAGRRLEELRALYIEQFAQQSVLRVDQRAAVSFESAPAHRP